MSAFRLFVALFLLAGAAILAVSTGGAHGPAPAIAVSDATEGSFDLACSPPPQCFTDRDCNRICGKKNGGVCVHVNSCYNECVCSQAIDVPAM
jgi:hypothetical protein